MPAKRSGMKIGGKTMGILAIIAGALVIMGIFPIQWMIGGFLILFGIVSILERR